MPDTPTELLTVLRQQRIRCPMCHENHWAAVAKIWTLADGESSDSLSFLRALCRSCGFVAWFQQSVPDTNPPG
jgi:hypothetical protein